VKGGVATDRRNTTLDMGSIWTTGGLGPAMFLLGAVGVHVYSMIVAHNYAPGNAGVVFYTDILIPIIGFVLLRLQHRYERQNAAATPCGRGAN
jgi:hypothetical protein